MKNYAIKISGPAGAGIMQAGETFSKALNRLGFYTLVYPEYPSQIRGGDNNIQIVFSNQPVSTPQQKIDLLLAFNKSCLQNHLKEVRKGGLVFEYDELGIKVEQELVKNSAAIGFLWKVLEFELAVLQEQFKEDFKDNQKVLELNLKAVETGYGKDRVAPLRPSTEFISSVVERLGTSLGVNKNILNLTGNEALVKGILAAKAEFASIYPMTPINAVLTLLCREKVQIFRPEDEIAGIMAAIGASYAGKRAMVATSGGGFSLMVEGLGVSGMAEIPLVIILGQRTGPSTGMATYSSQADLNFAIHAGQGEFPRIILTPGDLPELYRLGVEAFNLAEIYQVPVILMTDKYLAESRFSVDQKEMNPLTTFQHSSLAWRASGYKRYELTKSGISPRAFPGQTVFLTNSYEHDEFGFSTDDSIIRNKMMEKRMGKLAGLDGPARHASQLAGVAGRGYERYGENGKTTLVGWGSTKGVLLDFIKEHPEYNLVHFWRASPFPMEAKKVLEKAKRIICIEGNYSGQLADLIELKTGLKVERILKDDGRPFYLEEVEKLISNF